MSSDDSTKGDPVEDDFRFPNVCDGMDGEEILSAVMSEGEFPDLGATSSELIVLLQALNYTEPTETEMAQEIVVIGAMSRAFELEAKGVAGDEPGSLVGVRNGKVSGIHLKRLTIRSMAAAAVVVFVMGSAAAAAAAGSLPRGVQNVVARMVKAVSGVQLPDPEITTLTKSSPTTSTPTTEPRNMVIPAIPSIPTTTTTTATTSTSNSVPSSTLPTVAQGEGGGSSAGASSDQSHGSPLPSLPESSSTSSDGNGSPASATTATTRDQGSPPSTAPASSDSGKDGSSSSTTTTPGGGDSSGGSNGGDH